MYSLYLLPQAVTFFYSMQHTFYSGSKKAQDFLKKIPKRIY